ncbi:MAG: Asp-tRNA(Asn)/Glu-tRNA(Gln) amidotransferase subunit GatB [Planctomycetales bacterium]|nr:Asp-tRNA(Asn)/Glu-tRNA(Gln) amidotransferase subunit GatB [Planctomycetales bacterium]
MTAIPYTTVIGLEVHVQLKTKSKLFCGCSTEFGAPPNTQVCPVCTGQPGALPVMNQRAIELALLTGMALNCRIDEVTKWDRKNYFYPDLPKGYQISQFDQPICGAGYLEFPDPDQPEKLMRVRLTRAHLEEDAGKSMHDEAAGKADSRIDLNRTGTPLLEIVSEPDLRSAQAAKAYLTELRLLLTFLGVSDCNMQEGSLRADANVNLHIEQDGRSIATPIVEIKNLNSFRAVERAISYESQRQYDLWKATGQELGRAPKQTRGWDDTAGVTQPQREKEESSDYRYFPDPDLVPIRITAAQLSAAEKALGELPSAARQRLETTHELKAYDADVIVSQGKGMVVYFDKAIEAGAPARRVSSWLQQDVLRTLNEKNLTIEKFPVTAKQLAELLIAIEAGKLDNSRAKTVFAFWLEHPKADLAMAMNELGIETVDDGVLETLCRELLEEHPQIVEQVKAGNLKGLGSLIGAAKKKNPNADPKQVRDLCQKLIMSN